MQTAEVETELGLPTGVPLPEALFADNCVRFTHEASNLTVAINAVGALRSWHSRQQGYAAEHSEADEDSVISATSFDWTYRNEYSGDVTLGPMTGAEVMSGSGVSAPVFAVSETGLPMRELQRREDILWSCSLSLFEDDLHDKGVSAAVYHHHLLMPPPPTSMACFERCVSCSNAVDRRL